MVKRRCAISPSSWRWTWFATAAAAIAWSSAADARDAPTRFDVRATTLAAAIADIAREARVSIGTDGTLPQRPVQAVSGAMTVGEALARILAGTGYTARQVGPTAWRIEQAAEPARGTPTGPPGAPPAIEVPTLPIIVTGTKRSVLLDDLPLSVSRVEFGTAEVVDAHTGSARIAATSEGLAEAGLGPGRNRLFIRGVADSPFNGSSQSTVAVVLDEARLTYSAPDPDVRLVDVDRVEVLKGPQGSLYGTGALGGIYRIVTRRADLSKATLEATAGIEDVGSGGIGGASSAVVNLPLIRDRVALRLVGFTARESGWIDSGTRNDANATLITGGRADLGVEPGGGWRIDLSGMGQFLNARDSSYVYRPSARSRPAQLPEPHDNDIGHAALRASKSTGPIEITLSSGGTWHEVRNTLDATIGAGELGLPDPQRLDDDRHYRVWDSEARASGRLGPISWLVGASYLQAWQHARQRLEGVSGQSIVLADEQRRSTDAALFGDVNLPLTGKLSFDAGGRLSHNAMSAIRELPASNASFERGRAAITPSFALAWKPHSGRLVFLRYGSAFRSGGIGLSSAGTVRELVGDELATLELGWRESLVHGGRLEIGTWFSRWENVQSDVLGDSGLIDSANVGNAAVTGIEGSWNQPLGSATRVSLGANFTSALLTRNATGRVLDDRRLPVIPEYVLRGLVEHDIKTGLWTTTVHASMRYVGPAHLSFDPAIDRTMGDILETELGMTSQVGRWTLAGSVVNLLDSAQDTFAYGNPFRLRSAPQFTPQPPLTARLSVKVEL